MSLPSRPSSSHALTFALCVACAPATPAPAAPTPPAVAPSHEHGGHHAGHHGGGEHGFHKDFSDAKAFSASFDNPERDTWQEPEAVLDLMKIAPASTVVDLGAGTGYFVPRLSQRVGPSGTVLALDVEPKMVDFLKQRVEEQKLANVEPRLVPFDDPKLAAGSISRILIVNTWHHIDERPSYSKKLAAALDAQGEVWIVDFTLESESGPPPEYRIPAGQVVRELEQGGLHAQVVEPEPLPRQYIVRATR
ncbi:MAG TPA: class I SAM-dependent methyltransferase [Polyangiaceae bacterium]|nr:class I SAM-dependent methyltransferase [Polyangiaceae bacterium]